MQANLDLVGNQLAKMQLPIADPARWHDISGLDRSGLNIDMDVDPIHAWQELTPVLVEGLVQTTLGAPMHISHGGLQFGQVRYYDGARQRPGLPPGVAALVSEIGQTHVTLTLVNSDPTELREVVVQAGMFGEHQFVGVTITDADGRVSSSEPLQTRWYGVVLAPLCEAVCTFRVARYHNTPSYTTPWQNAAADDLIITPRQSDEAH